MRPDEQHVRGERVVVHGGLQPLPRGVLLPFQVAGDRLDEEGLGALQIARLRDRDAEERRGDEALESARGAKRRISFSDGRTIDVTIPKGAQDQAPVGTASRLAAGPSSENNVWLRAITAFPKLPELLKTVRELKKRVEKLENS